MAKEIRLPQLGQTMEEGTIVSALVKEGDKVNQGDVVFEIETDKATLEMESPAEGFVKKILVDVGATIAVNTPIMVLGGKDEKITQDYIDSLSGDAVAAQAPAEKPQAPTPQTATGPASSAIVRLPQLGQTMEEGTVVTVLIKEGDEVKKGDCIFEIETDKATLEMESPAEGFVKKILVETGATIPVGTAITVLAGKDEEVTQDFIDSIAASGASQPQTQPGSAEKTVVQTEPVEAAEPTGRIFASPRAKATARRLGVDLSKVKPSPGAARITEADVEKTASAPATAEPAVPESAYRLGQKVAINRHKRIVGEKMLQSKREIPCFYLTSKVDATELVKLRTKLNKTSDVKISFNDFIVRAVAGGLKQYPIMTGQLAGDFIQLAETIDIGLAISTEEGLVAPLVRDADKKTIAQIAAYSKDLVAKAKANKLSLDDLEGGCITVSNLGGFGIDSFIPIVVPGQCSILGIGKITDTCVPDGGNLLVRKLMNLTLSVNHRVVNGADAAQFLDFVRKLLENPSSI